MPNHRLRLLADAVYLAHATFTVGMLVSWAVLPWQVVAGLCVAVLVLNIGGAGCPITRYEFKLRRQAATVRVTMLTELVRSNDGRRLEYGGKVWYMGRVLSGIGPGRYTAMMLTPSIPSESVMARLLRVIGIHATPTQVHRLMLTLLVVLPLAAYLRGVLIG